MVAMRQQIDESNLELVNTLTQQMGTILSPLITNTNQTYELLAKQMLDRWKRLKTDLSRKMWAKTKDFDQNQSQIGKKYNT